MAAEEASSSSSWSREQDKAFENALATHPEDCADRWAKIAAAVPGKTEEQIRRHYELLEADISSIESGRVPLPNYAGAWEGFADDGCEGKKGGQHGDSSNKGKGSRGDQERRKGVAWTEEEHRLFLLGLERYGKGDWRSISRNFVISRTPTQVASHAQKYFIRLNSINKDRRRTSIHDITNVSNGDVSAPPGPITGQTSGQTVAPGKSAKQSPQPPVGPSAIDAYGTTIGQPVGGPMVSAVGTPINLPISAPPPPHMAYGVRAPVARAVVPGAPMNLALMTYPMPPTSAH